MTSLEQYLGQSLVFVLQLENGTFDNHSWAIPTESLKDKEICVTVCHLRYKYFKYLRILQIFQILLASFIPNIGVHLFDCLPTVLCFDSVLLSSADDHLVIFGQMNVFDRLCR